MDAQKEALRRIVATLANKNEELQNFLDTVDHTLSDLQVRMSNQEESWRVMSELEAELERLSSALEEKGAELRGAIREEQCRKEAELQKQLSEGKSALESSEELLEYANEALRIDKEDEFVKAARKIKERVTMAPAFRLSTRPAVAAGMTRFLVDFSREGAGLRRLHFLPVPKAPEIDLTSCFVRDNAVTVAWRPANGSEDEAGTDTDDERIDRYDLEFRKTNGEGARSEACWEKIVGIQETEYTITGLKFDSLFVSVRVRAANKAAAGDYCEPVTMETRAFHFGLDSNSCHPDLKVCGDTVSWEPQAAGVKGHDPRLKGKDNKSSRSATPSPNKTLAKGGARDRFAGESYTVLGDQELSGGRHYWELRPLSDWKSLSVGVAYRSSLGRFDQLGKSAGAWCLSAGQWLHSSLSAKHNNRAKALDWPLPQRIGVYCDYDNGDLSFIDIDRLCLLHSFKTKFSQPLVPAFTVWGGGITIATGLQVPSFMGNFLSTNRSLSSLS
ncbi:FSD1-like protein [Centroberyx gerrardi]|uniref:FSD1-like protein n=1 Tax=Centroberyx gerrardi TaxID=166262 RepID=UPI003AB0D614